MRDRIIKFENFENFSILPNSQEHAHLEEINNSSVKNTPSKSIIYNTEN